jgi:electron transport complex protein RnfC
MMSRIVSLSGGSSGGHNMLVPIGTPVSELLANSFSEDSTDNRIIWGNCLTGIEIEDPENTPIIKMTSVISVVRKAEIPRTACIHCGLCSECCPVSISPNIIYEMLVQGLGQKASEEGARRCISCGCCTYVCPAGIDLTSAIAEFANRGKVIETNSLLDNKAADLDYSILPEQETAETSLLEDYSDESAPEETKDDGSIVLPFDGGKKI